MILRSYLFKRVTIIGVGLMGGSLGMAIRKRRLSKEIVGVASRQSTLVNAIQSKAIHTATTDVQKAVRNADLVVLAAPVESIVNLLSKIRPHLKRSCIVTDVGSAKAEIVKAGERILSDSASFVGSHPLVGSEKKGVSHAREDLFENSLCIVTPTENTSKSAKEKIRKLWTDIGAKIKYLSPQEHDEILSYISHLPHLAAFGLMETIPSKILQFSSTGLKDTTRIAASSPQLWHDICMANSKNVLKALDQYVSHLAQIRKAIVQHDKKKLLEHFERAKGKRDQIK